MAISHVKPLLLLLASLFFLPVLCAIKFEYCNNNIGYEFGNITHLEINVKDYDTTITIFGIAKRSLKEGGVTVAIGETSTNIGCSYSFDEVADALPFKPGSNFVLTLTQVPLPDDVSYDKVTVTLNERDEDYIHTGEPIEIVCINFNPHSSTTSAALSE